jgi:hypothetical protein
MVAMQPSKQLANPWQMTGSATGAARIPSSTLWRFRVNARWALYSATLIRTSRLVTRLLSLYRAKGRPQPATGQTQRFELECVYEEIR